MADFSAANRIHTDPIRGRDPVRFDCMKSSTKDKIKGNVKQVKGTIKEKAGRASGNAGLRDRGTAEKMGGTIQRKVGDVKKVFGK
jgi:uncharacterized protein YjbJ (UPF0337 family)